jgi:formylglycine-generating enzyme required for sulfatase activity
LYIDIIEQKVKELEMRKDTTKKFLMRENRYANRMTSLEIIDFLSRKKKEIACDMIDFTNVFGIKSTHLNMKNTLGSGYKTREWVSRDKKIVEFNMVYCEEGSFTMGHSDFKDDNPPRPETIERSFLLGETEITQELYELVMNYNPSEFKDKSKYPNAPKHPVDCVSWHDAIRFCNKLSKLQGLHECYKELNEVDRWGNNKWECDFNKNGFRLPREKEWEYAAKAETNNRYAGCDDVEYLSEYAWYKDNSNGSTQPVATKKPNEWGFYDMSGNVWEWCWDKYDPNVDAFRIMHGGSYLSENLGLHSALRHEANASFTNKVFGFRVCRTI